ncbi:MAG: SAM-dependent methyltransferase [Pseudonocardiaceae bacterium]
MTTRAAGAQQPQPEDGAHGFAPEQRAGLAKPLSQVVGELSMSAWALTALGCADEVGLLDELGEPRSLDVLASRTGVPAALVEAVLEVLLAMGLVRRDGTVFLAEPALAVSLTGPARELLRADLRSHLLQSAQLIDSARRGVLSIGWRHTDPQILQAQGTRSSAIATAWVDHVFPGLDGLSLDAPEARFLDVGTGVAAIAIAVCRRFPGLRAVGLDPWAPALAEARSNVETARLGDRITLWDSRIEELTDDAVFDLVHVPALFLAAEHVRTGLGRVRTALKPGGWVLLQVPEEPGPGITPAVLRLWCVLWAGDASMSPARVEQMLAHTDYEDIRTFPPLPGPPVRYVVGRRPPGRDARR